MVKNVYLREIGDKVKDALLWGKKFWGMAQASDIATRMITHYPTLYQEHIEAKHELEALRNRLNAIQNAYRSRHVIGKSLDDLLLQENIDSAGWQNVTQTQNTPTP